MVNCIKNELYSLNKNLVTFLPYFLLSTLYRNGEYGRTTTSQTREWWRWWLWCTDHCTTSSFFLGSWEKTSFGVKVQSSSTIPAFYFVSCFIRSISYYHHDHFCFSSADIFFSLLIMSSKLHTIIPYSVQDTQNRPAENNFILPSIDPAK